MSTKKRSKRKKQGPRSNTSWVRIPIKKPRGRRLRVLIQARYSTDEQNRLSVAAQIRFVKLFLTALGILNAEIHVISEEEISGEQIYRPGINKVREGIAARLWDLIVNEDSSRFFRDPSACDELVGAAVDNDIRVICINDYVDTANGDEWEDRLYEAQRHHSRTNRYTIKRIKRAQEDRWETGAAMGPLKPGYQRNGSVPATKRKPEAGPFFDEVDPRWSSVVYEVFEKIAAGERLLSVGKWLDQTGLPKRNGTTDGKWTDKRVLALVRDSIYQGVEEFRKTVSVKQHTTGRRRAVRNDRDKVWEREVPKMRLIPDWLWYKANDVIDGRSTNKDVPQGVDHPLFGRTRDSQGPLSNLFFCCSCGGKIYQEGRREGGYRCGNGRRGGCWNKATALRSLTHRAIREAVVNSLSQLDEEFSQIITEVNLLFEDDGSREQRIISLTAKEHKLDKTCENLVDAIEEIEESQEPPKRLAKRLLDREDELARVQAGLQRLQNEEEQYRLPTVRELVRRRDEFVENLQVLDGEAGTILKQLVPRIEAVPYQQFSGQLVVLRARFTLNLVGLLPDRTRLALEGLCEEPVEDKFETIPILVDLFEPPGYIRIAFKALRKHEESGPTYVELGRELGLDHQQAHHAVQFAKKLRAAGRTDPYVELTEAPASASRWGPRQRSRNQS